MHEAASIAVSNAGGHLRNTKVLIVGAGPVGLTLAIDLGQRGVACTLIERKDRPAFLPKMERANARTMEIYRRMGLSKKIRAAGLSRHIPMDVYVVLDLARPPLLRMRKLLRHVERMLAICFGDSSGLVQQLQYSLPGSIKLINAV